MATYSIPENITWKKMDEGIVVLKLETGDYFTLNETAGYIWNQLIEKQSYEAMVSNFLDQFECEANEVKQDIEETLEYFESEELIKKIPRSRSRDH